MAMGKYFELTDETREFEGVTLHRIRATEDIPLHNVKAGDLGGWVQSLDNLDDNAWAADESIVMNDSLATHGALLKHTSIARNNSRISGGCRVFGSEVSDRAVVLGDVKLAYSVMSDNTRAEGFVKVEDSALFDNSSVVAYSHLSPGNAPEKKAILSDSTMWNNSRVRGNATVQSSSLCDNAFVGENTHLEKATIGSNVYLSNVIVSCPLPLVNRPVHLMHPAHLVKMACAVDPESSIANKIVELALVRTVSRATNEVVPMVLIRGTASADYVDDVRAVALSELVETGKVIAERGMDYYRELETYEDEDFVPDPGLTAFFRHCHVLFTGIAQNW